MAENLFRKFNIDIIEGALENPWLKRLLSTLPNQKEREVYDDKTVHASANMNQFLQTGKPIIPILEYVVTTHCNMRCKNCNTKIPYFQPNAHVFSTAEDFKRDLEKLLPAVDYILALGLVGGEPCLSPHLPEMICYACSQEKIKNVFVPTNCTLEPTLDLLEALAHPKVTVQISDYRGVEFKNSTRCRYEEWREQFEKHNIRYSNFQEELDWSGWEIMPETFEDKQDEQKVAKGYENCWGHYCRMLCDGKLLPCVLSVYIHRNLRLTQDIKENVIDVRANIPPEKLTSQIIDFYSAPFHPLCHYCHKKEFTRTERAEQLDMN